MALALGLCGCAAGHSVHGIPNFAVVKRGLYRGGQPTDEGWKWLASVGVSNVVKLNLESEGSDATAKLLKMRIWTMPIPFSEQIGLKPIDPQMMENVIVSLPWNYSRGGDVDSGAGRGTFVHCSHGQDRTGLFVALERTRWDGWSKEDAESEMLAHGFHKVLGGLWKYWKSAPTIP